jgi:hypothetical protein
MANPEHLKILKQGVEAWNKWRKDNPKIIPDLDRVDLSEANLRMVNLIFANLRQGKLYRADLSGADLRGANFFEADLGEANLHSVDLRGANFRESNLSGASLNESNLWLVNFIGADLRGVDFSNTAVGSTAFNGLDLSTARNLDRIIHTYPSYISIDTLYKSKGNIPEAFLRGCGVPDQMIEYAKSLTASPIEYYSCFISYSHKDEDFAKRLHADLQTNNVRCWYAPHDMRIGDKIRPVIDDSIRVHDKLLLILSGYSVNSDWVEHEVEHALHIERERKKGVLFPVRLDDAVMDSKSGWTGNIKRQRHIGDFTKWKDHDAYKASFKRLLCDLKAG